MITKRQLGLFILVLGGLLLLASLTVDFVGVGGWGEWGPLQRIGLCLSALALLVGRLLLLRGEHPA
ncbi:MAG TPA: hypothetical protein G4N98_10755 [Thermoflexia bacterium]|nr:hypothetical protein [Thermoflexia bacterium]